MQAVSHAKSDLHCGLQLKLLCREAGCFCGCRGHLLLWQVQPLLLLRLHRLATAVSRPSWYYHCTIQQGLIGKLAAMQFL